MKRYLGKKGQTSVEYILLMGVGITLILILRGFIGVEEKGKEVHVKYISTSNCNHIRCD